MTPPDWFAIGLAAGAVLGTLAWEWLDRRRKRRERGYYEQKCGREEP